MNYDNGPLVADLKMADRQGIWDVLIEITTEYEPDWLYWLEVGRCRKN